MSRFIFYTDLQLSGQTPRHRIDDYPSALVDKVRETYEIADREKCAFVVFGGDFFNAHKIFSYDIISRVMEVICASDLETYAVLGQHDIHGYNPDTFATSTIAFMERHCGSFHVIWEPIAVGCVELWPCHVWEDLEAMKGKTMVPGKANVLVAHHALTNKKKFFEVVSTADYGKGCPYDMVMSGHMHDGYATHAVEKTVFCNPGAVSRGALDEIDRIPQVAVVDAINKDVKMVQLRCAKPGNEVFGQDVAEIVRDMSGYDASAFVGGMNDLEAGSVDVHELIQKAGKEEGIRKEVLVYLDSKRK
jgi:DNA repair exonuclease SbcCD nuclease subunit